MSWDSDNREAERLRVEFCGSDDLVQAIEQVATMTGWQADQVGRWDWAELHDAIRVLLGRRAIDDATKRRALALWNDGLTWPEVAQAINGDREGHHTLMVETKRFAKADKLHIRIGKPGRLKSD